MHIRVNKYLMAKCSQPGQEQTQVERFGGKNYVAPVRPL
jgi:hypothetical protein